MTAQEQSGLPGQMDNSISAQLDQGMPWQAAGSGQASGPDGQPQPQKPAIPMWPDNGTPKPGLDSLVDVILRMFEFARDSGGELFLLPASGRLSESYIPRSFLTKDVINLGHQLWRVMAQMWNHWLLTVPEAEVKKHGWTKANETPSDTTVRNAVAHLEAIGMIRGRKVTAALRAAQVQDGSALVIDLGDDSGMVVYVNASGWRVCDPRELPCPPPVFRRSIGYHALPRPVKGGQLSELWGILQIGRQDTQALAGGWMVGAFFADQARPGIWLTGPPGSGKTTAGGALGRLIDGLDWLDGKLDRSDERNNIIRAVKCYVPSFDNMTGVTGDQSDWICQLVTGHRDMFRRMRTNFDDISMAYRRTFVATGLALPYGLGADALERIIEVPVDRIEEGRRVSDELIRRYLDEARPRLLGAILDHVAAVLSGLPYIPPSEPGLGRMNGYERILLAHDRAAKDGGDWLPTYQAAVKALKADKADDEPVVATLKAWIQPGLQWEGTSGQLLSALEPHRPQDGGWWPANDRMLSVNLTKNDGLLVAAGFRITRHRTGQHRTIHIARGMTQ
jgi:hypothetical protein